MRKLGEALKAVVAEDYEAEEAKGTESVLMNGNRRRVFEHVAWHPCCTASDVARALDVSGPTASWHLRKLVEAGYVVQSRMGRTRRFHVAGLSLEDADRSALAALSDEDASETLALVLTIPGLTRTQVAERVGRPGRVPVLDSLRRAGLVVPIADGRYRRYYGGPRVAVMERAAPKRMRNFRRRLLRTLERDRLSPEARVAPGDVLEVDVRFGDEAATLRLPMGSLLAARLG